MALLLYVLCFIISGHIYASQPQSGKMQAESEAASKKEALRANRDALLADQARLQKEFHVKKEAAEKAAKERKRKEEIEKHLENVLDNDTYNIAFIRQVKSILKEQKKLYVQGQLALESGNNVNNNNRLEKKSSALLARIRALHLAVQALEEPDTDFNNY